MNFCPRCGVAIPDDARWCPQCEPRERVGRDEEPRRNLARYLAGETVPPDVVRSSWETVRSDPGFTAHLRAELGLDDVASPCAVFRDQVATFADLAAADRDREVPELVEHVRECPSCRRLLWQVRPHWERIDSREQVLAEPISLAVGPDGGLRDRGLGPPGARTANVALKAGPESGPPPAVEWRFDISDTPAGIGVRVTPAAGGRVSAVVWADPPESSLDIAPATGGLSVFSGSIDDVPPEGLVLTVGRWRFEVQTQDGDTRVWSWEIDITTDTGNDPSAEV